MHVLQRLTLANLILIPLHNGLGTIDPPLKKKQLGARGGQLNLHRA